MPGICGIELLPFYQERISFGTSTRIWKKCLKTLQVLAKYLKGGWNGNQMSKLGKHISILNLGKNVLFNKWVYCF